LVSRAKLAAGPSVLLMRFISAKFQAGIVRRLVVTCLSKSVPSCRGTLTNWAIFFAEVV
jgi:hypothetical protein